MATYYYSVGRPEEEVSDAHTTLFQDRPGVVHKTTFKDIVVAVTPPFVLSAAKKVRG